MDGESKNMMTNPSEFDRTWRESGKFYELDMKYLDNLDWSEIPEVNQDFAKFYMNSPGLAKWGHDTMDIWEAMKIFSEINHDPDLTKNLGPGIFYYHRYLTGGKYKLSDMMKDFNELEPFGANDVRRQGAWINEYKRQKLHGQRQVH